MPNVVPRTASHQYTGTGGAAFVAPFANVTFVSEAEGVLTVTIFNGVENDAAVLHATDWLLVQYQGYVQPPALTNAEYVAAYVEV